MQSHTNNGFFKLVEALLQICSCFFSHSIQNYTRLTAIGTQRCHYLVVLPAKMSVLNSHMCDYAGLPFSDFK